MRTVRGYWRVNALSVHPYFGYIILTSVEVVMYDPYNYPLLNFDCCTCMVHINFHICVPTNQS